MVKKVILVGHCGPDSSYLRMTVQSAVKNVTILMADEERDLLRQIDAGADLLLVNRALDYGFSASSGVELIRQLRAQHPSLKAMLVSNYPDAQASAVAAGALPGFGKRELGTERVKQLIAGALHANPSLTEA